VTETAFVKHLLEYRSVHEAMVLALVGDPHAAEDLYQQAALIMTRKKDGIPDDGRFLPWSRKVIVNVVREHQKTCNDEAVELAAGV